VPTALIILPTGTYRAEEYLAAAARLGVMVVTASERAQALAEKMGDRFVEVPLDDPQQAAEIIFAHARRIPLDAVIAVDDEGLLAASLASEMLGLPHSPPAAVRRTRDKAAMRVSFATAGVPQPAFEIVTPGSPAGVAAAASRVGLPVVVKPCTLSGSRGVIRADSAQDAAACAERISRILVAAGEPAGSPQLVERFVPGLEVAVEAILSGGLLDVVTIFDKPDPLDGPYFEETFYLAPTRLDDNAGRAVEEATAAAVGAIGLTEGPVHAELRVPIAAGPESQPQVAVLEVAGRTIGGRCSKALMLEGGGTLEDLVIARAVGVQSPPARLAGPAGVLMIPIPRSGILTKVHHLEKVRGLDHITGVEITIPNGRRVQALPEGDRYLGFVFAAAPDRDDVERALRTALAVLEVEIADGRPDTVVG
jgi:biotin carboxylase